MHQLSEARQHLTELPNRISGTLTNKCTVALIIAPHFRPQFETSRRFDVEEMIACSKKVNFSVKLRIFKYRLHIEQVENSVIFRREIGLQIDLKY